MGVGRWELDFGLWGVRRIRKREHTQLFCLWRGFVDLAQLTLEFCVSVKWHKNSEDLDVHY